jgi:hypothetical protein
MSLNQDSLNNNLFNLKPAKNLSMGHGWQWVNEGFRYFTFSKYIWMSVMLTLISSIMLLVYFMPIFQLALIILLPLVTAGIGLGCYEIEQGRQMNVTYLVKGFTHKNGVNLVRYGFWLILLMVIAQMIGSMILVMLGVSQETISTELLVLSKNSNPTFSTIMASPVLVKYFTMSFIVMLPITALNLFAPYILIFSNLSALDSIKYSFVAVIKNINAIVLYAFVYVILFFIAFMVLKAFNFILYSVFSQGSTLASIVDLIVTVMFVLFFAALTYCSAYVAFKDVFLEEELASEEIL